ncbi:50S ribosomal protein L35 [Candidatus Peregrinibacteria bacterium]|nr:50S ribosomal protein L35 [Candidatus Peregrinibacteria bacterium]
MQKTHSGTKKRVIVKKKKIFMQKSSKNHLLRNKSKRQKNSYNKGMPLDSTNVSRIRKLLPNL